MRFGCGKQRIVLAFLRRRYPAQQTALLLIIVCGGCHSQRTGADDFYRKADAQVEAGDLNDALTTIKKGLNEAISAKDLVSEWKFRLLRLDVGIAQRRISLTNGDLREPMPQGRAFAPLAARQHLLLARVLATSNQGAEASVETERSIELARGSNAEDVLASAETWQGAQLSRAGQWRQADQVLTSALQHAKKLKSPYQQAGALVNLGMVRLARSRFDEAVPYFEQAVNCAGPQRRIVYSAANANLAICYYRLGNFDRAIKLQNAAIAAHEKSGSKLFLQQALGEAGTAHMLAGNLTNAASYYNRALSLAIDLGRKSDAALWAGNLASLNAELTKWDVAETYNQQAIELNKQSGAKQFSHNTLNSARIAAGRGQISLADQLFHQALSAPGSPAITWDAHAGLGALWQSQHKLPLARKHFEAALKVIETTRSDLLRTEFKLTYLTRLIQFYQDYVDVLLDEHLTAAALAIADSSRAQVLSSRSGSLPAKTQTASALVSQAKRSNTVLLSYWLAPKRCFVWVISSQGIKGVALPASLTQLTKLASSYRTAVEASLRDPVASAMPEAQQLTKMLLSPIRQYIAPGSRVIIIPDGILHSLNFEMLPSPHDSKRYWIEDAIVSVSPSLPQAQQAGSSRTTNGLLLVGDPLSTDSSLPALKQAGPEMVNISTAFRNKSQTTLSQARATTKEFWAAKPEAYRVLHFAAHGLANADSPLDSAVVLTGGKLYARDIMTSPLTADLVTLSSCRGSGQKIYSGEGLVGFAWAFLHAGARHVIASLWDVDDRSTSMLMSELYARLSSGATPDDALHGAKLTLLHASSNYRKPYYWAPFQLYRLGL